MDSKKEVPQLEPDDEEAAVKLSPAPLLCNAHSSGAWIASVANTRIKRTAEGAESK
jgi:hypothetical protein